MRTLRAAYSELSRKRALATGVGLLVLAAAPAAASAAVIPGITPSTASATVVPGPTKPAATPPASLLGESLQGQVRCGGIIPGPPDSTDTTDTSASFTRPTAVVSGSAVGPYPGTFSATITVAGVVLSRAVYHESFTIRSSAGNVFGSKQGFVTASGVNTCLDFTGHVSYSAFISTRSGFYVTSGDAVTGAGRFASGNGNGFYEDFDSSNGMTLLEEGGL